MRDHVDRYAASRAYARRVIDFTKRVKDAGMELRNETSVRFGMAPRDLAPIAAEHSIWSLAKDGCPIATRATLAELEERLENIIERLAQVA